MKENKKLTLEEAKKIVETVIGTDSGQPPFGTRRLEPGDIALVFRAEGGVEILSHVLPDLKSASGAVLDLNTIGMRGMVALAMFKIAHHDGILAETLLVVNDEIQTGQGGVPPMLRN